MTPFSILLMMVMVLVLLAMLVIALRSFLSGIVRKRSVFRGLKTGGIALLACLALFSASCACFGAAAQQTKECAVVHSIVDCTEGAAATLGPAALAIIMSVIDNGTGSIDWAALELKLEGAGFKDGGCVIAQLENEIVGKAAASPGRAAHTKAVQDLFGRWKAKHEALDVKWKIKDADGTVVIR